MFKMLRKENKWNKLNDNCYCITYDLEGVVARMFVSGEKDTQNTICNVSKCLENKRVERQYQEAYNINAIL